jgi:hypothetical protein
MVDDDPLHCLVGKVVTEATVVLDYVQLALGPETGLSIYNDYRLVPDARLPDLVGQKVIAIASTKNAVFIHFEGLSLTIDLHDSAFHGPEAMQLHRTGHGPVIWT